MFRKQEEGIATQTNEKGLKSDHALALLGPDLKDQQRSGMV